MTVDKKFKLGSGYQPVEKGYRGQGNIDTLNPPKGGSGVPPKPKNK